MARYTYTAYGLHFECSFPLPELRPCTFEKPDITIGYGEVPTSLPQPSGNGIAWQAAPGQMLLRVSEVARYLLVGNREIRIHPFPGSTEADVRLFLLGSVLGAVLHARHILVLHASVIQTERGAVLFMGRSGAGKSTLLGAFLQRGYAMLADDKAGITLAADGKPQVMPGFPLIRLAEHAAKELRYPVDGHPLPKSLGKYVLPVAQFCENPLALFAAYSLNPHNQRDIRIENLLTPDGFHVLNRHTYRRRFVRQAEQRRAHFRTLEGVSNHTRVARVLRPDYPCLIDELRERIEEDLAQ